MPIWTAESVQRSNGEALGGGAGDVMLDEFIKPWGMLRAVDATNGPWTATSGITAGLPTGFPNVSGKTFYAWDSGVFNLQSQNWEAAGTATGQNESGYSAAINKSTPRVWTYGGLNGRPLESMVDVNFMTDSANVTFVFYARLADQAGSTTFCDVTTAVEVNGTMMELGALPATSNSGSGVKYLTQTVSQARMAEWRAILPGTCYFLGVLVDTGSSVRKAPNKLLFAIPGDSWNEANGCTLASPIGGAWPTGTYRTHSLPTAFIRATGASVIFLGQGGTGEYNANDGQSRDANYIGPDGSSVFQSVSRVNDFVTKFGARNPIMFQIGGWNDGTLPPAPVATSYQTRSQEGIQRFLAAKPDLRMIYATVEPVNMTNGSVYDLMRQGQLAAWSAAKQVYPNNIVGYIDLKAMWLDTSNNAGSQRYVNVNQSDTIHLHVKGGVMVANWLVAALRNMRVSLDYINKMMSWGL